MVKTLRAEVYRTFHHRPALALLVVSLVVGTLIASFGGIGPKEDLIQEIEAGVYPVETMEDFGYTADQPLEEQIAIALNKRFGEVPGRVAGDGLAWVGLVFLAIPICQDFTDGQFGEPLKKGASRGAVFWSKWLVVNFLFVVTSCLILAYLMLRCCGAAGRTAAQLAQVFGLFSLMIWSWGSVCSLIAFCCRGPIISAGVTFVLEIVCMMLPDKARRILVPLAAARVTSLWALTPDTEALTKTVVSAVIPIVVCTVAARIVFQFTNLKKEVLQWRNLCCRPRS